MADKTSHQAGSVCTGPAAATYTCFRILAAARTHEAVEMAHVPSVPVTRKTVPWDAMPGDSSLWNILLSQRLNSGCLSI